MKLVVKDENRRSEYEVKDVNDLIEGIKDYCQYFLPEYDDLAGDFYKDNEYDALVDTMYYYYVDSPYRRGAVACFTLLKDVVVLNDMKDIINKLPEFNNIFKDAEANIAFSME